MSSTTNAFLRERLVRVHEQMTLPMVDAATIRRTSSMSLPVNILSFQDGYRRAATSLVHGTTPSAVTMDSDGRLVERLVFQGGESKDDYLQRLVSAVKAVIE